MLIKKYVYAAASIGFIRCFAMMRENPRVASQLSPPFLDYVSFYLNSEVFSVYV